MIAVAVCRLPCRYLAILDAAAGFDDDARLHYGVNLDNSGLMHDCRRRHPAADRAVRVLSARGLFTPLQLKTRDPP